MMTCSDFSCPCSRSGTGDRGSRSCGLPLFPLGHSELCPPELLSSAQLSVVLHLTMLSLCYRSRVWLWPDTFDPCQGSPLWAALNEADLFYKSRWKDPERGKTGSLGLWREPKGHKRLGKPRFPPCPLPMCILTLPSQGVTNSRI